MRNLAVPAALAVTLGLAACGSSDSSSSTSTPAKAAGLPRAELAKQANAICKTANTAATAVPAPASYEDPAQAAAYFEKIAPITATETKALLALQPADDVKDDYAAFTAAQSEANDLLQRILAKARAKDASGLDDLAKVKPAGAKVAAAARTVGATGCG